ncbi:hypothetical protein H6G06_15345 [Anabaena sphaerica FACHB-251]|uniref:Uncharacterized protein n=1 Tax=Anabaena sphaerica FACHB-251 TaxID=2692883 RepID=A0A926WIM6_9NOST|nr:hypothetical protein [Anabaena sphaerica]MBD2294820.1 hypothetical protein [Anabaena sphaerica FACHB-251]
MTLLVSWIGIDSRKVASIYIAADSRISWANLANFDHGRKVFAFNKYPDILGYCGDVMFPSIVLGQIVEMADNGLLFKENYKCKQKFEAIKEKLIQIFHKYPHHINGITQDSLQIIHASRESDNCTNFFCHLIEWKRDKGWSGKKLIFPEKSDTLAILGSGAVEFNKNYERYIQGPNKSTSRNVFHCFCDTLFNSKDINCGGAPQLVGIYSKPESTAKKFGIIKDKKRYLFGSQIDDLINFNNIEWRNDLFELCDGNTMKKFEKAQKQPNQLKRY